MTYKISKNNWSTLQNFNSLQEANDWALLKLGSDFTVEVSTEQLPVLSPVDKLKADLAFGEYLINKFLIENREIIPAVTVQQSLLLSQKFEGIEKLARLGDMKSVLYLITDLMIDDVFTQDRKDEYINILNNYLNL
jgi:hypothetical protein